MFNCVQKTIKIPQKPRGSHIITNIIKSNLPEMKMFRCGVLNVFLQHTSASITVNENCCPDVRSDLESWMNEVVPEDRRWDHSSEGADDMPAHAKCSMIGCSINIPITNGELALGTWQGIYLNEHREYGGSRTIVLTVTGAVNSETLNRGV